MLNNVAVLPNEFTIMWILLSSAILQVGAYVTINCDEKISSI